MKTSNVLKQLRLIKGCLQKDIADALLVERSTYSKWECKTKELTLSQMEKLASFYGIGLNGLIKMLEDGYISNPDVLAGIMHQKK
jgi:transcriptional regulator with XRE-family HTH domain